MLDGTGPQTYPYVVPRVLVGVVGARGNRHAVAVVSIVRPTDAFHNFMMVYFRVPDDTVMPLGA